MSDLTKLMAAIGVAGVALSFPLNAMLNEEQIDMTKLLAKVGAWSAAASIPVGLWAMQKWPDKSYMVAIVLTGLGFGIKEYMLHGAHEDVAADVMLEHAAAMPA